MGQVDDVVVVVVAVTGRLLFVSSTAAATVVVFTGFFLSRAELLATVSVSALSPPPFRIFDFVTVALDLLPLLVIRLFQNCFRLCTPLKVSLDDEVSSLPFTFDSFALPLPPLPVLPEDVLPTPAAVVLLLATTELFVFFTPSTFAPLTDDLTEDLSLDPCAVLVRGVVPELLLPPPPNKLNFRCRNGTVPVALDRNDCFSATLDPL